MTKIIELTIISFVIFFAVLNIFWPLISHFILCIWEDLKPPEKRQSIATSFQATKMILVLDDRRRDEQGIPYIGRRVSDYGDL